MSKQQAILERALAARWAILQVGRLTWDYFQRGVVSESKADLSPVTVADREAESLLRETFTQQFPGDGFLGEEFGEQPSKTGFKWIIDPIDATRNFVRRIPLYANLIGLEFEGQVVGGFVNVPPLGEVYHAVKGLGAYCNDRRISVSRVDRLDEAQLVYSSLSWFDKTGTTDQFLGLVRKVGRSRGFGDFYGYLLVAAGSVEIALEPTLNPWDIAAVKPIVEEAGGVFTDWFGTPTIYGKGALAGNPAIHAQVLKHLHG